MTDAPPSVHTVVIGGGLAGSSAALALARAGRRVTLVEGKSRLGGRAGSYTDPVSGDVIDYCQHVGMRCCESLIQLIELLGQQAEWRTEEELHFYGPGKSYQCLKAMKWLPPPLHLVSWLWNWPGLSMLDRGRIAYAMQHLDRLRIDERESDWLDQTIALDWLRKHGQNTKVLERFWSTVLVSALGEELDRVNLQSVAKVFQDGFLRKRDAFHLLIPQKPLSELFGSRMETALRESGAHVRLGQPAKRLLWAKHAQGSAFNSIRCSGIELNNGEVIACDQVVVSVPWYAFESLMTDAPEEWPNVISHNARHLGGSPISGVHTWWDRPWLPTRHAALVGHLCQWVFPAIDPPNATNTSSLSTPLDREYYYQIVISASRQLPRGNLDQVRTAIQDDLALVFPQVAQSKMLRIRVVTDPKAVFSVVPGSGRLRPSYRTASENVWIAGDWTRTGWPATMEGAIRSGLEVARLACS